MLAVVLVGIGLGGVTSSMISRRLRPPRQLLSIILLLAAIGTLLSYLFFPVPVLQGNTNAFHIESWQPIERLSLALMFPVAFLSGSVFPLILTSVQREVGSRMNSTGLTILFNTTGAALGPLLACFVLLPWLGFQSSLILCAAGYTGLAILASEKATWSIRRPLGIVLFAVATGLVLIIAIFPYNRDERHFANARRPYEADGSHLIKRIEGTADTLQLLRRDLFGEPYYYRLVTNAFSMSATMPRSQRYMRLFAYLPLAFRPESNDVLLLCYGCGVTADALLHGPNVKRMDIVDISKEVFAFADSYSTIDYHNPLRDPRVHTVIQDGRFFLQASPRQYDVISGEPPPPKVAGSVNLYTQAFFKLMDNRLK